MAEEAPAPLELSNHEPNVVDAHVGNRLRIRRAFLRVSQEKLGEHLGVTFQQIQKYEKGANRIGAGQLFLVAAFLKVDIAYFYEGLEATSPRGFAEAPMIAFHETSLADGHALTRAFVKIQDPESRRLIIDLAKKLAETQS